MEQSLREDILQSYGLRILDAQPLPGGFLNRLWRVQTDAGLRLVKQFSPKRYTEKKLDELEAALSRQEAVRRMGVVCPQIFLCQGRTLRRPSALPAYCIMEFCPGENPTPENTSAQSLARLGFVLAEIHNAFSRLPIEGVKGFPIDTKALLPALWENYTARSATLADTPPDYQAALLAQPAVLEQLSADFFARQPMGIAHEDFTPDNVLFDETGRWTVIDFDRNCYSFLLHDLGRAMLSFALGESGFAPEKLSAFLTGYTRLRPLRARDADDALRITWCIESLWWIDPECFTMPSSKATRFRDEIVWLTKNFDRLDAVFHTL